MKTDKAIDEINDLLDLNYVDKEEIRRLLDNITIEYLKYKEVILALRKSLMHAAIDLGKRTRPDHIDEALTLTKKYFNE